MSPAILVVEDNPDNMKLFRWLLEDAGHEFTGAPTGEEALVLLEQAAFDLVVMDISLPGMDGKEATRRLRADERFASMPVIAATAHAAKDEEIAILEAGVSAIATKPIDEESFLQLIEQFLRESR
jgi:two-component system, cell cycle response regulator DivK